MYLKTELQIHEERFIDMKGKTDKYIIIAGDFRTLLSVVDRTSSKKISKYRGDEITLPTNYI